MQRTLFTVLDEVVAEFALPRGSSWRFGDRKFFQDQVRRAVDAAAALPSDSTRAAVNMN